MKTLIFSFFIIYSFGFCFGQKEPKDNFNSISPSTKVEFFALPGVLWNHANIGFSFKTRSPIEHNISLGSTYSFLFGESFGLNLSYSLNTYLKDGKNYIPIWFRVKNTRRNVGFEEGYHPHTLRYGIGTGFGRHFQLGDKWGLRTELGLGASVNLTASNGKIMTLDLDLSDYGYDQYYPDQNPKIIPSFRFKLAFTYDLRKNNP